MFGDCLKKKLKSGDFLKCENKKTSDKAFWVLIRDAATEDIKACCPNKVDSDKAIGVYYEILLNNMEFLPDFVCSVVPSNNQEKFRVIIRNVFTSNAFNPKGLANQAGIIATKEFNGERKGERIVFKWEENK